MHSAHTELLLQVSFMGHQSPSSRAQKTIKVLYGQGLSTITVRVRARLLHRPCILSHVLEGVLPVVGAICFFMLLTSLLQLDQTRRLPPISALLARPFSSRAVLPLRPFLAWFTFAVFQRRHTGPAPKRPAKVGFTVVAQPVRDFAHRQHRVFQVPLGSSPSYLFLHRQK
jgi:hypothetical protein